MRRLTPAILILLAGCGIDPKASPSPCESILDDHALLRMSIAVQRHKDLDIDPGEAYSYCRFVTPDKSDEQNECCWWVVDEIYGPQERP